RIRVARNLPGAFLSSGAFSATFGGSFSATFGGAFSAPFRGTFSAALGGALFLWSFFSFSSLFSSSPSTFFLSPSHRPLCRLSLLERAQVGLVAGRVGVGALQFLQFFLGVFLGVAHVVVDERQKGGPHLDVRGQLDLDIAEVLFQDVGTVLQSAEAQLLQDR